MLLLSWLLFDILLGLNPQVGVSLSYSGLGSVRIHIMAKHMVARPRRGNCTANLLTQLSRHSPRHFGA